MKNNFDLLCRKEIYEILDGDIIIEEKHTYAVRMPRLSGPKLCEISNNFGLATTYGSVSRWVYMDDLFRFMIKENRMSELLAYLFNKDKFTHLLDLNTPEDIDEAYTYTVESVIGKINTILYLGRHELKIIQNHFYITETGKAPIIEAPHINLINVTYVQGLRERCTEDFESKNFDSVITKSRTLMEEVLIYIIEKNNERVESKGDLNRIYNQVKGIYNMRQDKGYDGRVNGLLSGLEKIVQSVSEMRNMNSDAHGVGRQRIAIKESEARLVMNSAISFCEYILSIYTNRIEKSTGGKS